MPNARFGRIGVAVFALLSLAACTGGSVTGGTSAGLTSDPRPTSSPSSPSSPAPPKSTAPTVPVTGPNVRPGEKPPVLAALGRTKSARGAAVFARYWFAALDWGYATTSSVLARELYLPSCTDCTRFMTNFDGPRSAGLHFRGGRLTIISATPVVGDRHYMADAVLDVTIRVAALQTRDAAGSVLATVAAIPSIEYRVWLTWSAARWHVAETKQVVRP